MFCLELIVLIENLGLGYQYFKLLNVYPTKLKGGMLLSL